MKEIETDFELDEDTLREIEEAALKEAGLDVGELDDDFLNEVRKEAGSISDDEIGDVDLDSLDIDFDDDLDDFDIGEVAPRSMPAVTPADSSKPAPPQEKINVRVTDELPEPKGADDAVERAKEEARSKARKQAKRKAVAKAQVAMRHRVAAASPHAASIDSLEKDLTKKPSSVVLPIVVVCLAILVAIIAGIAIVVKNLKTEAQNREEMKNVEPRKVLTDRHGNPITEEEQEAVKLYNEAFRVKKKNATLPNINNALAKLEQLKKEYPEYAKKMEKQIEAKEERLRKWKETLESFGPAPQ